MQLGASAEVDFEEEVAKYKKDIKEDIQKYKKQEFVAPKWIKEALYPHGNEETESNHRHTGASSSSWEGPITDSQAVHISDYILTEQEEQAYFSADENESLAEPDQGPAWERMWFSDLDSDRYPADLSPYGPEAYGAY